MNNGLGAAGRVLAKGRIDRLRPGVGRRIECLTGSLWITQDGDLRDVVVDAGAGYTVDRHADVLVSALADSSYLLLDRCPKSA